MINFEGYLDFFNQSGFLELVVPFIVIFILLFIASSEAKFFNKATAALFSAVLSLMVVIPHVIGKYERCWDFVDIVNRGLPKFGIFFLAVIVFVVLMLIIGINTHIFTKYPKILFLLTLIVTGIIVITSKPSGCPTLSYEELPIGWLVIGALLLLMMFWWKRDKKDDDDIY